MDAEQKIEVLQKKLVDMYVLNKKVLVVEDEKDLFGTGYKQGFLEALEIVSWMVKHLPQLELEVKNVVAQPRR